MKSLNRFFPIIALLTGFFVLLMACSRAFRVEPFGQIDQGVVFRFYKVASKSPTTHNIVNLTVQEKNEEDKWRIVGALEGKQSLKEVGYGRHYENLKDIAPPKPLSLSGHYRVLVSDNPRIEPLGYAGAEFQFNLSGVVEMTERMQPRDFQQTVVE